MNTIKDTPDKSYSSYNRNMVLVIGGIMLISVLVNIFVDPLRINEIVLEPGINIVKPKVHRYARIAKPIQIENHQPDALVLGSSRTEFGIRPSLINEVSEYGNAFNAAVSAGTYHDMEKFYFHAVNTTDVKEILIGVDFFAFNAMNGNPYQYPKILAATSGEESNPFYKLNQWLLTYLSFDMLKASASTLRRQDDDTSRIRFDGSRNNRVRIDKFIERQGLYQTFIKTEHTYVKSSWSTCSNGAYTYQHDKIDFNTLGALGNILEDAHERGVKIKLFMAPAHSRLWVTLDEIGLWDYYEQWRRDMAVLVSRYPNAELWDFSNFNDYTNEKLPEDGDRKYEMAWHIDSSHYRSELGDMALRAMYDAPDKDPAFGIRLTPENVEEQLAAHRRGRDEFKALRPVEYAALLKNVEKALAQRDRYGRSCSPTEVMAAFSHANAYKGPAAKDPE